MHFFVNKIKIVHGARKMNAKNVASKSLALVKKNLVLCIAVVVATITCFFVPIDRAYADYFDWSTVGCLFATMLVVGAFRNIHLFEYLAGLIVKKTGNIRGAIVALVAITYVGSMVLANDMALLTFLPLGYFVLKDTQKEEYAAFTFVMQNVAANLGGMLTPFGNPQNLYLYSYYQIPTGEFFRIMAIPFAVAFVMIAITCICVKNKPITLTVPLPPTPCVWRTVTYCALFALSICTVFRLFPFYWGVLAVFVAIVALDWRALFKVDFSLLLTFCAFFVFSGNLSRIPAVQNLLSAAIAFSPLLVGVASCQVISNVPSAVLLSRFTLDYKNLLVAVNIGGLGTPIASLASLITLNKYRAAKCGKTSKYLLVFLAINFSYLALLIGTQYLCTLIGI